MIVLRGNDVSITWTITKCDDSPEDLSGVDLGVFAVNGTRGSLLILPWRET